MSVTEDRISKNGSRVQRLTEEKGLLKGSKLSRKQWDESVERS
jgi:hypothetical protein